jgi:ADP-ribose pyrophosphatase YjhB (NUDIX family)
MNKYVFEAYRYALVICRNSNNKYLVVKETNNRGWWIPGGKVENEELFYDAGKR